MANETFVITRNWLHLNSTPGGGWTAQQLAAICVPWPPKRGWLNSVCGREIAIEQRYEFERLHRERQVVLAKRALYNDPKNTSQEEVAALPPTDRKPRNGTSQRRQARKRRKRERQLSRSLTVLNSSVRTGLLPQTRHSLWVNSAAFLVSYEWRRVRMAVLKRDGATCRCCGATAKDGTQIQVDHIKPRRLYPELALDETNLQVLCAACNHGKGNWDQTDWRPAVVRALPAQSSRGGVVVDGANTQH